jgi:hypothetical protein
VSQIEEDDVSEPPLPFIKVWTVCRELFDILFLFIDAWLLKKLGLGGHFRCGGSRHGNWLVHWSGLLGGKKLGIDIRSGRDEWRPRSLLGLIGIGRCQRNVWRRRSFAHSTNLWCRIV